MRNAALPMAVVLAMTACSNSDRLAGPTAGPPPPADLVALYQGSEIGAAGLVNVEVQFFRGSNTGDATIFAGRTQVQVTVNGDLFIRGETPRFRVNGVETNLFQPPADNEIEVWAGLGGDQDWITVYRIR